MRAQRSISSTVAVVGLAFLALMSTTAHTVRAGETLRGIAASHGTTVAALAYVNHLTDADLIYVGQQLAVPTSAGSGTTASTYKVRSGDTLASIASRHGTSVSALVQLNQLSNPNLLRLGQVLKVPEAGGTSVKPPAGGATTHVVRAGETLGGIGSRYGIKVAQIVAANALTGDGIYIGQQLRLVPAATTAATYVVRVGDNLFSIAQKFGTTVRALQDANTIRNADLLSIGRMLDVPAGGTGGESTLRCPVERGAKLMNDWGFPRSGGRFHEGSDLFAPRGTPVVATVSGHVIQTFGQLGGNQVKLFGDDGVAYYYTHLERFGSKGRVSAGTVIGYVGTTGNAAGGPPHVHFEIHPGGGAAVNPYPRVVGVC